MRNTVRHHSIDFAVGIFLIIAFLGFVFLAFRVSDLTQTSKNGYYTVTAEFDNIGGLKPRAAVAVSGVKVGEVTTINLNRNNFHAIVVMKINKQFNHLPIDTAASIFTQGILGSNYISLSPGFEQEDLADGSRIETTHPALVLENLIGQLVYSLKSDNSEDTTKKEATVK